jgi:hypothetical protein
MRTIYGDNGTRVIRIGLMHGGAVLNDTGREYEINYGYNTVSYGHVSRIAIAPGEAACRLSKAGPRDLARWEIGSRDEHEAKGRDIFPLSGMIAKYA